MYHPLVHHTHLFTFDVPLQFLCTRCESQNLTEQQVQNCFFDFLKSELGIRDQLAGEKKSLDLPRLCPHEQYNNIFILASCRCVAVVSFTAYDDVYLIILTFIRFSPGFVSDGIIIRAHPYFQPTLLTKKVTLVKREGRTARRIALATRPTTSLITIDKKYGAKKGRDHSQAGTLHVRCCGCTCSLLCRPLAAGWKCIFGCTKAPKATQRGYYRVHQRNDHVVDGHCRWRRGHVR